MAQSPSDVMCLSPKPGLFSRLQFIHRFNHEKRGNEGEANRANEANVSVDQLGRPLEFAEPMAEFSALAALSLVPLV